MAYTTVSKFNWGSGPKIPVSISYDRRRSGVNMQYRVHVNLLPLTGTNYFGYPVYLTMKLDDATIVSGRLIKAASQSQWEVSYFYDSGWVTVADKLSGSVTLTVNLYSGSGSTRNNTYTFSLAVDPAVSTVSAEDADLGQYFNITITKADDSFTHTLKWSYTDEAGNTVGETLTEKDTADTYRTKMPNTLANYIPNTRSIIVDIACLTYNGDTLLGTSHAKTTQTISDDLKAAFLPQVDVELSDPLLLNTKFGGYVNYKSRLKVKIIATGRYGATISKYRTTIASASTQATEFVGIEAEQTFRLYKSAGNHIITATVTDSRGLQNSVIKIISVLDYDYPAITSFTAERCNESGTPVPDGDYCKATFSARVSALNNKNTAVYRVQHRLKGDTTWESIEVTAASGNYAPDNIVTIFAADADHVHEVRVVAEEFFGSVSSAVRVLGIGVVLAQTTDDMTGLAFGRRALISNTLDVDINAILRKGLSSYDAITFDEGEQTAERALVFKNDDGENPHNCALYGGDPSSTTGIGMYDRKNAKSVFNYDDVNSKVSLGDGGMDLLLTGKTVELQGPLHVLGGATFDNHIGNAPTGYSGYGRGIMFGDPTSKDRYYLLIDSNGKLWTGTALGNAKTITWREK